MQIKLLKIYNRKYSIKTKLKEYKILEDFDNALNFNNKKIMDYFYDDYKNAVKDGCIKVYTLKPLEKGSFIHISRIEAKELNGGIEPYCTIIPIEDALFTNVYHGQYVPVMHVFKRISEFPLQYKWKYVNNKVGGVYELVLPEKEKITHEINTHMVDIVRNPRKIGKNLEYKNIEFTYTFYNKDYGEYIFTGKERNNVSIHDR